MLSPKLYQALGYCFNFSMILRVIPYKWDNSQKSLSQICSKTDISIWYCTNVVLVLHQVFLFIRLYDCIVSRDPTFTFYVGESIYVLGFFLGTILQFALVLKRDECARFFNHYINYFEKIQGKLHDFLITYIVILVFC